MPTDLAASSTLVPSGTVAFLPSMVSSTIGLGLASLTRGSSPVQLAGDDGGAAPVGGERGDRGGVGVLVGGAEDGEAGGGEVQRVGLGPAVGDHVEAELAYRALGVRVDLPRRHLGPVHDELEVRHERFDVGVDLVL